MAAFQALLLNSNRLSRCLGICLLVVVFGSSAGFAQDVKELKNPTFVDKDGDSIPDGWNPYPPGDGSNRILAPAPGGGLIFKDNDKSEGLGLEQWVPVQAGLRYTASAEITGSGVSLNLIFCSKKPAKAGDLSKVTLSQKAAKPVAGSPTQVVAVAPEGATYVKIWFYCPKVGVADAVIRNFSLTAAPADDKAIAAPTTSPSTLPASAPPVAGPAAAAPEGNLLKNSSFADADSDGTPDGWNPYPPGNGNNLVLAPVAGGGLTFKDNDKENGLGIEQWVPVQEGVKYTAKADVTGTGKVSLMMIFAPKKPERAGDLKSIQLSEKSAPAGAGVPSELVAVAPAGAKWMKLWVYCPKAGVADVVIHQVTLLAAVPVGGAAPADAATPAGATTKPAAEAAPAQPLPPGLAGLIDFETGDLSQAHQGKCEGGNVTVISAAEGPVREGKYAAKISLKLDQHRAEVPGNRSEAYGVARYGWSLYIPKEFDAFTHFSIITQWHSWGSGRESPKDGGPPTSMTVSKGELQFKLLHQGDEGWTSKADYFKLGSIDDMRERWTDFVMEVNWQPPGKDGWLKLYKNGQQVIDYKGTTWYADKDKGPYFKFGIYKGSVQWKGTEEGAVIYVDAARMALGEKSTYQMVDPAAYTPRPEKSK